MLPAPKIMVIDDNLDDVQAIVAGLNGLGTTAVGFHYTGEHSLPECPCLRLVFLDLHLMAGGTEQQILQTVGIFADVAQWIHGPYAIILWSSHVHELEKFQLVLFERFRSANLPLPMSIEALDKTKHIPKGDLRQIQNPETFKEAILDRIQRTPLLVALLGWEEHVARAADDAIRHLVEIPGPQVKNPIPHPAWIDCSVSLLSLPRDRPLLNGIRFERPTKFSSPCSTIA